MPEKVFVDKSTFAWYDTSHLLIYQHLRRSHHAAALRDLYRADCQNQPQHPPHQGGGDVRISFEGASRLVSLLSDAAGAANRRAAVRPVRGGQGRRVPVAGISGAERLRHPAGQAIPQPSDTDREGAGDGPGHCREDRPAGGGRQRGLDTGAAAGHVRRPNLHQRPSGALGSPRKSQNGETDL